jgi:hypothetical protein
MQGTVKGGSGKFTDVHDSHCMIPRELLVSIGNSSEGWP